MTNKEQIKNRAKEYAYKNYEQGGDSDTWEDIYTDGAGYGYQLAVENACEWLEINTKRYWMCYPEEFIKEFKDAMKGGDQ